VKNPKFQNNSNRPSNKGDRCTYCKKEGHLVERCYFLHPHLRPKLWDSKKGGAAAAQEEPWGDGKKKEKKEPLQEAKPRGDFITQTDSNALNRQTGSCEPTDNPNGSEAGGSSGSDSMH
jgi:hypothetical protein